MRTPYEKPTIRIAWWLRVVQAVLLRLVKVDESWTEQAKIAVGQGSVVFVLRNRSLVDFLCLEGLVRKRGLPSISFVTGLSPFLYMPWWQWIWHIARRPSHEKRLRQMMLTVASGHSSAIFLRKPATLLGAIGSRPVAVDGINLAAEAHESLSKPVVALPTVFLWGERAMRRLPGTMDFVFGSNEYPRLLRSLWLVLRHRSIHELISGAPVNLSKIHAERGFSITAVTGAVRAGVGRQIEEIRRSRLGSLTKPSSRVKHEVYTSPKLRSELRGVSEEKNISESEMLTKAHGIINKLAADVRPRVLSIFSIVMALVWKKLYTGIDIDDQSVERIRTAVAGGATLLLPTHKSHIDYLVLSQIMQDHNIMLPHIAAGENLAFWPMGWIFRSSGAFFIRRRFIHDRFYTAVVNAYIRRLVQLRYAIEVFIEGGRSRTGKLLRPKQGMLEMTLQALPSTPSTGLWVVPISIGYERVIEEGAYIRESEGAKKKSESIRGLVKTTKVLFHRYGRLYVRAAEPFRVDDVLGAQGLQRSDLADAAKRRDAAHEIAWRTLQDIQTISIVTPAAALATAILTLNDKTIAHRELAQDTDWLLRFLQNTGAPLSPALRQWQPNEAATAERLDLVDRYIKAFVRAKRIKPVQKGDQSDYQIEPVQRMATDYYKNNIIHYLVPYSLVSASLLAHKAAPDLLERIEQEFRICCDLYHWEFLLQGCHEDQTAASPVARLLGELENQGIISRSGTEIAIEDESKLRFLADVLRNYHEIYWATLDIVKQRVLSGQAGDTPRKIRALAEEHRAKGAFIKPEGHSQINIQSAIAAYKDLRILRPGQDASIFDPGELGHQIDQVLRGYLGIK